MRTEIAKTELFNNIEVRILYEYKDYTYQYSVDVFSKSPFQRSWKHVFLKGEDAPSGDVLDYCFFIHSKVIKHIRKRLKKGTTHLLRKEFYKKLWDAQNGRCYLCNDPLTVYDCTKEHVVPRSRGGKDSQRNQLLSHAKCNEEKGDRLPTRNEKRYLQDVLKKIKELHYYKIHHC